MGGGSSRGLLEKEQLKPIDASDIRNGDWESAKKEVVRLRELLSLVDPSVLDRSKSYAVEDSSPSSSQYMPSSSTANSGRSLLRTPPKIAQPMPMATTYEIPVAEEGDEMTTNKESKEGRDYWQDPMGLRAQTAMSTRPVDIPTAGDNDETTTSLESREGRDFWKDPMGTGTGLGTASGQRFGTMESTGGRPITGRSTASGSSAGGQQRQGNKLIAQIVEKTFQRWDNLQEAFLKMDYDRSGFISREEFRVAMGNTGLPLNDDEFDLINQSYPHKEAAWEEDKGICYPEFIRLMTGQLKYVPGSGEGSDDNYYGRTTSNTAYPTSPSVNKEGAYGSSRPGTSRSDYSTMSNVSKEDFTRLQDTFSKKIFSKYHSMKTAFQKADKDKSGFIEAGEFAVLLRTELGIDANDDEVVELLALFDTNGDGRLAYAEFVKCLHTY